MKKLKNRTASELLVGNKIVWDYDAVTTITKLENLGNFIKITFIDSSKKEFVRHRRSSTIFKIL